MQQQFLEENFTKCPNCGTELLDDAKFCSECGAKVEPTKIDF